MAVAIRALHLVPMAVLVVQVLHTFTKLPVFPPVPQATPPTPQTILAKVNKLSSISFSISLIFPF